MLLAFLSLMHAAICMHITDTEMHMAERFLNSWTTVYPLSLFLSLGSSHSKRLKNLGTQNLSRAILSDFPPSPPFVWNIWANSSSSSVYVFSFLFFLPRLPNFSASALSSVVSAVLFFAGRPEGVTFIKTRLGVSLSHCLSAELQTPQRLGSMQGQRLAPLSHS